MKSTASFSALHAEVGVVVVVEATLGVAEGVAIAEGRAAVHAHAQLVDEPHVALPVAARPPTSMMVVVPCLIACRNTKVRSAATASGGRRRHLALERRGEAHVVRRAVVVLRHVEQEVVAAIAGGVDMGIDEPRRDELAAGRQASVDRARVGPPAWTMRSSSKTTLPLLVHFVALAVERHHPAAFDEGFHGGNR